MPVGPTLADRGVPGTCPRPAADEGCPTRRLPFLRPGRARLVALALACLPVADSALSRAAEAGTVDGLGRVREDGSLAVGDAVVHLAGIYMLPSRSGRPRGVLALGDRVSGFVRCAVAGRRRDGSFEGFCSVAGRSIRDPRTDLGAWMVEQGLALAGPDAPPEYFALERLAEAQGRGLWADPFGHRRRRY